MTDDFSDECLDSSRWAGETEAVGNLSISVRRTPYDDGTFVRFEVEPNSWFTFMAKMFEESRPILITVRRPPIFDDLSNMSLEQPGD